jgi:hypothetical protein
MATPAPTVEYIYKSHSFPKLDWETYVLSHSSPFDLNESLRTFHHYYSNFKTKELNLNEEIVFQDIKCTGSEALELVRYFNYKAFRYAFEPVQTPELIKALDQEASIDTKIRRIKCAFIAGLYMGKELGLNEDETSNLIESIIVGAINEV